MRTMQRIIQNNLFPSKNNEYPLNVIISSLFPHWASVHVISPIGPASCRRSIPVESLGLAVMDWVWVLQWPIPGAWRPLSNAVPAVTVGCWSWSGPGSDAHARVTINSKEQCIFFHHGIECRMVTWLKEWMIVWMIVWFEFNLNPKFILWQID